MPTIMHANCHFLMGRNRGARRSLSIGFFYALALILAGCTSSRKEVAEKPQPETAGGPTPYNLALPVGLVADSIVIPKDNPLTVEKIKLGKRLYFEKNLSLDRSISCA